MKAIRLTDEARQQLILDFASQITTARSADDFTFKYAIKSTPAPRKITVNFTGLAWMKMRTLINTCGVEIAWQGLVEASDDRTLFDIVDILVYPQTVSGATVNTDEVKYENWHQALDDNSYNKLRFQGHSHVNMATNPSSVDRTMYDNILQTLSDDSFYIFMILNKAGAHWINIYDLKNNAIYESADIIITVEDCDLVAWYTANYKLYINHPTPSYVTPTYQSPIFARSETSRDQDYMNPYRNAFDDVEDDSTAYPKPRIYSKADKKKHGKGSDK